MSRPVAKAAEENSANSAEVMIRAWQAAVMISGTPWIHKCAKIPKHRPCQAVWRTSVVAVVSNANYAAKMQRS